MNTAAAQPAPVTPPGDLTQGVNKPHANVLACCHGFATTAEFMLASRVSVMASQAFLITGRLSVIASRVSVIASEARQSIARQVMDSQASLTTTANRQLKRLTFQIAVHRTKIMKKTASSAYAAGESSYQKNSELFAKTTYQNV